MELLCLNCANPLHESFRFCPQCSQKTTRHRLSIHDIAHDAIHYFTHADRGLFSLIRDLTTNTGKVAREYVGGMRKKHFPPLNFYLIVGFLVLLAYNMQEIPPELRNMAETKVENPDNLQLTYKVRQAKAALFMAQKSDMLMILALPITTLAFWLFYRRSKYNFIEHMVACMYMAGFSMLVYAAIILPTAHLFDFPDYVTSILHFGFQLAYATVFYYRFMESTKLRHAARAFFATLFGAFLWIAFIVSITQIYVSTEFWGLLG